MQIKAKLFLIGGLVAAIIVVYTYASAGRRTAGAETVDHMAGDGLPRSLQGTWESFGSQPGTRQIKLITKNHFTWVFYNRVTQRPMTVAGGTYTFAGNTYTEHVEFGSDGVQHSLAGHNQVFKIRFEGDHLSETGTLSNGMKINEVWRRLE